jgi:hypothetical protein
LPGGIYLKKLRLMPLAISPHDYRKIVPEKEEYRYNGGVTG